MASTKVSPGVLHRFSDYVSTFCQPPTDVAAAEKYARLGEEYLALFAIEDEVDFQKALLEKSKDEPTVNIAGYILWCLLAQSYGAGLPFGKGMFNIEFENKAMTRRLHAFLAKAGYQRISSHYRGVAKKHFGIDDDDSSIMWPWQFKTVVFGLCDEDTPQEMLYFKPERYGFDFVHHPLRASQHLYAWAKYLWHPQKLPGTESFRETDHKEIHIAVSRQGLRTYCGTANKLS